MRTIDLRSDTVTTPTPGMREAMASAEVGDDQFGEDPTVNALQDLVASLLGREAALWLPTGTMANQVALRALTRPGDDVIVSRECHAMWHETGASAANAGVQFTEVGEHGVFSRDEFDLVVKPRGHATYAPTTLVEIENTHNRSGGRVFPQAAAVAVAASARDRGIASYLDGARLWNASVATGLPPSQLAAPFDLVGVCLSKGLGAPGGSLLAGSSDLIARCHRYRRMAGGAMRQAGIFAAAGLYALDHHLTRLADDHAHAAVFAAKVATGSGVRLDPEAVQTNIIVFGLGPDAPDAATVVGRARAKGVLMFAIGPRSVRAVTHLDVTRADCEQAADTVLSVLD